MNLLELRQAINRRSGVAWDSATLNDIVNAANRRLGREREWPWLQLEQDTSGVADDDTYVLDADVRRIRWVTVDSFPLTAMSDDEIEAWDIDGQGRVRGYSTVGTDTVVIRPIPAGGEEIVLAYVANEPLLGNDTDAPLCPEAYHDVLVDACLADVLERSEPARAAAAEVRYQSGLKSMVRAAARLSRGARIRVRPGGGL